MLAEILGSLIQIIIYIFIARAIISWLFVAGIRNEFLLRIHFALASITEPMIAPLRRVIPPMGMIDITPLVAIIILIVIRTVIFEVL
ncbi:MAG: YggT family protein [Dehalococcoidia bacterium]